MIKLLMEGEIEDFVKYCKSIVYSVAKDVGLGVCDFEYESAVINVFSFKIYDRDTRKILARCLFYMDSRDSYLSLIENYEYNIKYYFEDPNLVEDAENLCKKILKELEEYEDLEENNKAVSSCMKKIKENLSNDEYVIVVPLNEECYNKWEDSFADTICTVEYGAPDNAYNGFVVTVLDVADMIEKYSECDEGNFDLFYCPDGLLGEELIVDVEDLVQIEDIYSVFEADDLLEESGKKRFTDMRYLLKLARGK